MKGGHAFVVAAAGIASACIAAEPEVRSTERPEDAVVRIQVEKPEEYGSMSCTGALVAPNLILAPLRCVSFFKAYGRFSCRVDGSLTPPDLGYGWIGEPVDPANIQVFFGGEDVPLAEAHGAEVFQSGSAQACIDDIALVLLDRALPSRGLPLRLARDVERGEALTFLGAGSPRARASMSVLSVGPDMTGGEMPFATPRAFVVGDEPCVTSLGGVALSDETGAVVGMFSRILAARCERGAQNLFVKIAPFGKLLREAFAASGHTPQAEGS